MIVYARLATIEAARSLARYRLRSALASLGVAVAVATVVWVAAIGQAAIDSAMAQMDALGDNLIWIEAGARSVNGARTGTHGMNTLLPGDATAIRDEVPRVTRTSENADGKVQVIANGRNWSTTFRGVSPDYQHIKRWDLAAGAFFGDDDVEHARAVIVIGQTVKDSLFGDEPAVGAPLRIGGSWFTIVGVLAPKGQSPTGRDEDDVVMMPWPTVMQRILGSSQTWLDDIVCSADSPADMAIATEQIVALLRERHRIGVDAADDFNVRKPQELIEARIRTSHTLRLLMVVLAALALFVGGVGIMNVMLAAVAQRTREIGVRLAIGARPAAVRVQFLGEAALIAGGGAALGLALGELGRGWVERISGWPMHASPTAGASAAVATLAMGVAFGFYPALRASRLDPIAALRDDH